MFVNEWVDERILCASHNARCCEDNKINMGPNLNRDCNLVRETRRKQSFSKLHMLGHHRVTYFTMRLQIRGDYF